MIVDEYIHGNDALQQHIEDYLGAQATLQTISNPSGTFLPDGRLSDDGSRNRLTSLGAFDLHIDSFSLRIPIPYLAKTYASGF